MCIVMLTVLLKEVEIEGQGDAERDTDGEVEGEGVNHPSGKCTFFSYL